jgi:hypothetical protein
MVTREVAEGVGSLELPGLMDECPRAPTIAVFANLMLGVSKQRTCCMTADSMSGVANVKMQTWCRYWADLEVLLAIRTFLTTGMRNLQFLTL